MCSRAARCCAGLRASSGLEPGARGTETAYHDRVRVPSIRRRNQKSRALASHASVYSSARRSASEPVRSARLPASEATNQSVA